MKQVTITVASLREFFKRVQFIDKNTILPILANLKLEHNGAGWQIVKNNLEAVCIGPVEATGEPSTALLDERIFSALVAGAKGESITITTLDSMVRISDGLQNTDLPIEDPAAFPVNPLYQTDKHPMQLTSQHLRAIKIASNFTAQAGPAGGNFQFVHITPTGGIYGFHNNHFYINSAFLGLPEMSLRAKECEVICATDGVGFINMDRHYVFFSSGFTYIFTKGETKPINITGVVDRLQMPGKDFVISRVGLDDFCSVANIVSESPLANCVMSSSERMLRLSLKDANYNRATERLLPCQGEADDFSFNSRLLVSPVRSIPYDTLECKTLHNNLIISGRGGAGNGLGSTANEWFCFVGMQK